jgi:hypothetical protein
VDEALPADIDADVGVGTVQGVEKDQIACPQVAWIDPEARTAQIEGGAWELMLRGPEK